MAAARNKSHRGKIGELCAEILRVLQVEDSWRRGGIHGAERSLFNLLETHRPWESVVGNLCDQYLRVFELLKQRACQKVAKSKNKTLKKVYANSDDKMIVARLLESLQTPREEQHARNVDTKSIEYWRLAYNSSQIDCNLLKHTIERQTKEIEQLKRKLAASVMSAPHAKDAASSPCPESSIEHKFDIDDEADTSDKKAKIGNIWHANSAQSTRPESVRPPVDRMSQQVALELTEFFSNSCFDALDTQ